MPTLEEVNKPTLPTKPGSVIMFMHPRTKRFQLARLADNRMWETDSTDIVSYTSRSLLLTFKIEGYRNMLPADFVVTKLDFEKTGA